MHSREQEIALWMTPLFVLLMAGGLFIAGFIPPLSPRMPAEEVAAFYAENTGQIRAGLLLINAAGAFVLPFFVVVALQIRRMHLSSQSFFYSYLMCVGSNAGLFMVADLCWLTAAFRLDRSPEIISLFNDLGWVCFVAPIGILLVQVLVVAGAILLDERPRPIFPRWVGIFNLAVGVMIFPSALSVVYDSGPFAWDGAIAFWLRYITLSIYLMVMFVVTLKAVRAQAAATQDVSRAQAVGLAP